MTTISTDPARNTDAASSEQLNDRWAESPRPAHPAQWLDRAQEVADILAVDAVDRDRANKTPHAEVGLLKNSGLVTLLGPVEHGGGGQTWDTVYRVIRTVARADGSIGQLLGYHYLWSWAARLVATDAQIADVEELYTRENLFFGGAVNPRDSDLSITEVDGQLAYNGRKSFSTGGQVADLTVLEGVLTGPKPTSSPSCRPTSPASYSARTGTTSASG